MSNGSSSTSREPRRLRGTAALTVVIATNLANANSTDQYLAGLAALALALAHDILIHRR